MMSPGEEDLSELGLALSPPCECCARCGVQGVAIDDRQAACQGKPGVLDRTSQGDWRNS